MAWKMTIRALAAGMLVVHPAEDVRQASMRRCPRRAWAFPLTCMLAVIAGPGLAAAQQPLNLDFERASVSGHERPWGWSLGWSAFAGGPAATFALDSVVRHRGRRSLRIAMSDASTAAPPQSIMLQIPADFARGREVRLSGWMRTEGLHKRALLTLEAWKDGQFASADTVSIEAAAARANPQEWTRHELTIRVPPELDVHSVVITAALQGSGAAWFDDFELSVDGMPITEVPIGADPPSEADLGWLAAHVTPLRDVRVPSTGIADDADLDLFADIVGDARIVALGESTHGTREFFLVKHRLLEFLVRKLGFTVFAIEANQLAVEKINRYVQGGDGTARDVMRVMFRVWNTEEMLELVEWMRAYNAEGPRSPLRSLDTTCRITGPPAIRCMRFWSEPSRISWSASTNSSASTGRWSPGPRRRCRIPRVPAGIARPMRCGAR